MNDPLNQMHINLYNTITALHERLQRDERSRQFVLCVQIYAQSKGLDLMGSPDSFPLRMVGWAIELSKILDINLRNPAYFAQYFVDVLWNKPQEVYDPLPLELIQRFDLTLNVMRENER